MIHIKPSHRGRFTARAHRQGHSVGEQIKHDVGKGGNTGAQANFARMARRHWKPLPASEKKKKHVVPRAGGRR